MILEVPFAMMAWVSVVLIQALVHFGMFGARRDSTSVPGAHVAYEEAGTDDADTYPLHCHGRSTIDEDEGPPEGLETLLSQTGDDVMSIIRSNSFIENRARKELERDSNRS